MSVTVKIDDDAMQALGEKLEQLPMLYRNRALRKSIKAMGKPLIKRWRQLIPNRPKQPGRETGVYRKSLKSKVVDYPSNVVVLIVGSESGKAPHAHLVEQGHEMWVPKQVWKQETGFVARRETTAVQTGRRVEGKHYGEMAVEQTQAQQYWAMGKAAKKAIDEILAGN